MTKRTDSELLEPFNTFIRSPLYRGSHCKVTVAAGGNVTVTCPDGTMVDAGRLYCGNVAIRGVTRLGVEAVAPSGHWMRKGGRNALSEAARELAHLAVSHPLYKADWNDPTA